jgi:hypothetical protein
MNPSTFNTVLTSAAVSTIIAGIASLIGQAVERRARRKELIFVKAVELAKANRDYMLQLGKDMGGGVTIHDYAPYAEMYYWLLQELEDKGKLPKNWQQEIKEKFPSL